MSRVQKLRLFVTQRINAAVEEILGAFEKTIVKYEQEAALCQEVISRQHALLCALNKPLMDVPSADAVRQQRLKSYELVPPQNQNQEDLDPPHVTEEQQGEQLQDLDEADIIQFTYNARRAGRPEPEPAAAASAAPDPDVQLVSSETENSDDYDKEPADLRPRLKRGRKPGGLRCRVCSRSFRARRFLLRHVRAHLQEAEPVCGLCGQRFDTADGLKLHFQTHRTKTQSKETHLHQHPEPNTQHDADTLTCDTNTHTCDDCGATFLQVWKKRRHRCDRRRKRRRRSKT